MFQFSKYIGWVSQNPISKYLVFTVLLLVGLSIWSLPTLNFSFEMNDFFPDDADTALQYKKYEEEVGSLQYNYMIAVGPKDDKWDFQFVKQLENISNQMDKEFDTYMTFSIMDVAGTSSSSVMGLLSRGTAIQRLVNNKEKWVDDSRFSGFLFTKNGKAAIIYLQQDQPMGIKEAVESLRTLLRIQIENPDLDFKFMGTGYLHSMVEKIQLEEIIRFAIISLIITFIFSYIIFQRNIRLVFISISSLAIMYIFLAGAMALTNIPLNLLMSLLPIVLLIVGTADIVHFFTKYQLERSKSENQKAIKTSIDDVGLATLLTSITSAFAFIALTFNSIPAIRNFGIAAALAVLIAYLVLIFFTVPLLSIFLKKQSTTTRKKTLKAFTNLYLFGLKRKAFVLWTTIGLSIIAIIGLSKIVYDFDPMSVLPKKGGVLESFTYFEDQLNGIRPVEIYVNSENSVYNFETLHEISLVENYLQDSLGLGLCLSPTYAFKLFNSFQKRSPDAFVLPDNKNRWEVMNKLITRAQNEKDLGGKYYNIDSTYTRVLSSMPSLNSNETAETITKIDKKLEEINQTSKAQFELQGFADLVDQNVKYIRTNMIKGLGISLLLVCLLIAIVFQKRLYLIVAFIPNLLPLLMTASVIGFLGINFDSTLTMIFALLFGLVVDDSIHFLSKYRIEKSRGNTVEKALKVTIQESGKAIVYTSILIFSGLLISVSSSFYPTRLVGVLMGITILFALLCDLLLLPYLLRKLDR